MPDPLPPFPRPLRTGWSSALVLIVAVLAAYANTLQAPFVYDDVLAIPQNPTLRAWWRLGDVLWPAVDGGVTVSGRPVLNLSFALNYAISGVDPWSYHVVNTLIHAGAALLLCGIVRRTAAAWEAMARTANELGLVVAGAWALHPLQTQAVTYVVQRAESLMGFFYLLTLYAFVRALECRGGLRLPPPAADLLPADASAAARRGHTTRWLALSVAACALGMATKEVMATAPLLLLLYDRTFAAGSFRAAWHGRRGYYAALGGTWLLLAAILLAGGGNRGGTVGLGTGVPLWAYPLTQFEALARYLGLGGWPHPLVFEYGTRWARRAAEVLPYAAVVAPLLAATAVALWRWPVAGFFGAWFFVILAPTSLAPGTIQMIVEHRMYLPLAGLVAAAALAGHRIAGRHGLALLGAGAVALLLLTVRRNHDYRSNLGLWHDTVAKRPENPRAHEGLAEALAALGRMDDAIKVRERSVALLPDESHYHYNLALTLAHAGRREEAVRAYRESLRLFPREARTHNNLAILLAQLGREAEALPHYREAVRLRPNDALYHYNYGIALMREKQWDEAAERFQAALAVQPDHADAHFNLGAVRIRQNRPRDALEPYASALRQRPDDADYVIGYGTALVLTGRPEEAVRQFQRALALKPDSVETRNALGSAFAAAKRHSEAIAQFEAVLQRVPTNATARFKLGNALLDVDRIAEAIPHYEAALRRTPEDAEAWHNLGVAFARLERWDDARRGFDQALRLKPDYADARRNREQLRQVTGR